MSRGPDAATLLERALIADAARWTLAITVPGASARRWASATFTGARVTLTIEGEGDAGAWLAALPDADLPIRGHLVADLVVLESGREGSAFGATIEALTVEEG